MEGGAAMLIQTLNSFLLAALVVAVPVLVTLAIWTAAMDLRQRTGDATRSRTVAAHRAPALVTQSRNSA